MSKSASERERAALIEALGQISMFCDFRPATTMLEQIEHLLVAIDAAAAMALRKDGAVALAS